MTTTQEEIVREAQRRRDTGYSYASTPPRYTLLSAQVIAAARTHLQNPKAFEVALAALDAAFPEKERGE